MGKRKLVKIPNIQKEDVENIYKITLTDSQWHWIKISMDLYKTHPNAVSHMAKHVIENTIKKYDGLDNNTIIYDELTDKESE